MFDNLFQHLVPFDLKVGQFMFVLRKRMKLPSEQDCTVHHCIFNDNSNDNSNSNGNSNTCSNSNSNSNTVVVVVVVCSM